MGARKQLASIVRCSCDGEMPPVIRGGSSAQQTSSPVVSTSMSCAQSSGVTMSCADSSHATPSHAQYRGQRQQAGGCHRAVAPRARAGAAAPPPPAAPLPRELSGGSSASGRCRARAEMPIEAAHGAAAAACATLPTASSYPGILPRPCRAPGATLRRGKRLLQRQRTISPIYGRSKEKKIGVR